MLVQTAQRAPPSVSATRQLTALMHRRTCDVYLVVRKVYDATFLRAITSAADRCLLLLTTSRCTP